MKDFESSWEAEAEHGGGGQDGAVPGSGGVHHTGGGGGDQGYSQPHQVRYIMYPHQILILFHETPEAEFLDEIQTKEFSSLLFIVTSTDFYLFKPTQPLATSLTPFPIV